WQADRDSNTIIVAASNSSHAAKDAAVYVTDGVADEPEINAALVAAAGGRVYLMEGTYVPYNAVSIPNNTTLTGAGFGTLVSLIDGAGTRRAISNADQTAGTGVVVSNMTIGVQGHVNGGTQQGIYFVNLANSTVTNVKVNTFYNGNVVFSGSSNITFTNNIVAPATFSSNISLTSSSNNIFTGNNISTGGNGPSVNLNSSSNNLFADNTISGSTGGTISLSGSSNTNIISNNRVSNSNGQVVYIFGSTGNTISGNYFGGGSGITLLSTSDYTVITENTITTSANSGISIGSSNNVIASDNMIITAAAAGISLSSANNATISNNKIQDAGGTTNNNGISLASSDNNSITGNTVTDSSATTNNYAITITDSASDTNYLADNSLGGGAINDLGTGTKYANQLDASGNSINKNSGALVTQLQTGSSANLFQAQDASGNTLFNVASNGQLTLGRAAGANGSMVFANSSNANTVTINTGATSASYALTLPTAGAAGAQCLKSTSGSTASATDLEFGTCFTGTANTLQDAYTASSTTDPMILLNNTNGGITIADASTPITGNLFSIQNNAATATYLGITSTAFTLQDTNGKDSFVLDMTSGHLKVYEKGATQSRFADIYYDSVNNEAVFAASSGNTRVGSGSGHVTINLTNAPDLFTYTKTVTLGSAYAADDMTVRRNITAGANALAGSVLRVESTSTGTGTVASNILWLNENNTSASGALILATKGGPGTNNEKFKVDTDGNVTLGSAGVATLLSSGSGTAMDITSNGAATWQTSTGNLTLQAAGSTANRLVFNTTNNRLEIGAADTTGTLLVLDTKTDAGDPAGVNGGMYYNSNLKRFRCYVGSTWQDCLTAMTKRQAADQQNTTVTFADITEQAFPVLANTDYEVKCTVLFTSSLATAGLKFSMNSATATAPTGAYGTFYAPLAAQTNSSSITSGYNTGSGTSGVPATATVYTGYFNGVLRNGANAGTLNMSFAAEVAATLVVKAGSYCEVKPLN
ncbi:MAG: hypothetical protein JWP13_956, partial [Candidatus Saccharibacteria bacterium]|nr:hypothetical protein [Candidatus Saccharibacteria bacterium]